MGATRSKFTDSTLPAALTIAGSDSSGGAGLQADLKTFSALGVYGASVVTAVTAQNTLRVSGVYGVPADFVALQIRAVFEDLKVGAVKTGMLLNTQIVCAVAQVLREVGVQNLVVDPVMVSKGGSPLLEQDAVRAVVSQLFPISSVITPNIQEAAVILGWTVERVLSEPESSVQALKDLGPKSVLLKGGHGQGATSDDLLYDGGSLLRLSSERIVTPNTHGTGCTLASAIAAQLALGFSLEDAVRAAKSYITEAIKHGQALEIGHGHGPVHHFWKWS